MTKRLMVVSTILLMTACAVYAEVISEPVATVELIRNVVLTKESLDAKMAGYAAQLAASGSQQTLKPLDVLNIMINDELVLQGAERDGYMISNEQLEILIADQRKAIDVQLKTQLTDQQFAQVVLNSTGMDIASYKTALRDQYVVDKYVRATQSSVVNNYKEPTDAEISAFFRQYRQEFINPEMVRISHIYMPFTEEDKSTVKAEMDKISRWIRYNTYTFEELVPKYSKDSDSITRGGDIGWLAFDDDQMRAYLGEAFVNSVFELQLGRPSGVLESQGGYHIVKVTSHIEPKLLGLDDTINPESAVTVRSYIAQTLLTRSQQASYVLGINTLVAQLRQQANVVVLFDGGEGETAK